MRPLRLLYDIETNGLLPAVDTIHCIAVVDLDNRDTVELYHDHPTFDCDRTGSIDDGLARLSEADELSGHNIVGYDDEVLRVIRGWTSDAVRFDTLVASRLVFSDLRDRDFRAIDAGKENVSPKIAGHHTLKAWGIRLGKEQKDDFDGGDWQTPTAEMFRYCQQDVRANVELYDYFKPLVPKGGDEVINTFEMEQRFALLVEQMNRTGVQLDVPAATSLIEELEGRMADLEAKIQEDFPPRYIPYKPYPSGKPRMIFCKERCGKFDNKMVRLDPGSRRQLAMRLTERYGWAPTQLTQKGNPILNEEILLELARRWPEVEAVAEYQIVRARIATLRDGAQAYFKLADENGILRSRTIHIGTVTGRCAHTRPNLGNVCSPRAPYGMRIREIFTPHKGYIQAGFDASGLEFRCLAHYVGRWDDGELTDIVLNGRKEDGTDIHSSNAKKIQAAGVECTRDDAKTAIYATLYGGSAGRISEQLGCTKKQAKAIQTALIAGIKGLSTLSNAVTDQAEHKAFVKAVSGMRVGVRMPHMALNYLLQSCGAFIMKAVTVFFQEECVKLGMEWGQDILLTGHIHDELQCSLRPGLEDKFTTAMHRAFERTTAYYGLRCPVEGESSFGTSWAQTH
jgi:DNA polymerase I-like protein with 3'-5' exonuclease and polymerase domains